MVSRRELESLVLIALREIRTEESELNNRFPQLALSQREARAAFVWSLMDLQKRTDNLERLLETLDADTPETVPAAA